jgi:hypothetical protein
MIYFSLSYGLFTSVAGSSSFSIRSNFWSIGKVLGAAAAKGQKTGAAFHINPK